MARLPSQRILGLVELIISSAVHLLYGFYIFSTAVAWDLSQALTGSRIAKWPSYGRKKEEEEKVVLDGSVPPIVLVHGIFGFGQGVRDHTSLIGFLNASSLVCLKFGLNLTRNFAEARRAVLLRRSREEGRAHSGARLGVSDQYSWQAGACWQIQLLAAWPDEIILNFDLFWIFWFQSARTVLLPEGRAGWLRRGAQQDVWALAVRQELWQRYWQKHFGWLFLIKFGVIVLLIWFDLDGENRALPDMGRAPPDPLRWALCRRAGRSSVAADASWQGKFLVQFALMCLCLSYSNFIKKFKYKATSWVASSWR